MPTPLDFWNSPEQTDLRGAQNQWDLSQRYANWNDPYSVGLRDLQNGEDLDRRLGEWNDPRAVDLRQQQHTWDLDERYADFYSPQQQGLRGAQNDAFLDEQLSNWSDPRSVQLRQDQRAWDSQADLADWFNPEAGQLRQLKQDWSDYNFAKDYNSRGMANALQTLDTANRYEGRFEPTGSFAQNGSGLVSATQAGGPSARSGWGTYQWDTPKADQFSFLPPSTNAVARGKQLGFNP